MKHEALLAILSVVGWHANESIEKIIQRKTADIEQSGRTVWLFHSQKASIPAVQQFGNKYTEPAVIFLRGSAFPASSADEAAEMSADKLSWNRLPTGISKVTGRLPAGGLVIGSLSPVDEVVDLWDYLEWPCFLPIKFRQGASTACGVPSKDGPVEGMKSRFRQAVAIGKLVKPYGVFLR
jgi:hypothetical protein